MVVERQISGIKHVVSKLSDARELAKQIVFWILHESTYLRKPMALIISTELGFTKQDVEEIWSDFHDMLHPNGATHLNALIAIAGCGLHFKIMQSYPNGSAGIEHTVCTISLVQKLYEEQVEHKFVTPSQLKHIDISKSGFCPELEKSDP